jgi:NADH:ubiquinone oxidoreductase subunit F (NADH-binding)/NADH:ubiquinone oxidoreductase subunit E
MLVQHLRAIQNRFGFLPDAELLRLSRETGVAAARIEEVASFFPGFRQERDRPAAIEVRVCRDMTCHHRGSAQLLAAEGLKRIEDDESLGGVLEGSARTWAAEAGRETPASNICRVSVEGVSCLGRCDRAPAVWVERSPMPAGEHAWVFACRDGESLELFQSRVAGNIRAIAAGKPIAADSDAKYEPHTNGGIRFALPMSAVKSEHPPLASPGWDIDPYHAEERSYAAVRKIAEFLTAHGGLPPWEAVKKPEEIHPILGQFRVAGLQGMGGAGVLAYTKWLDVWQQPGGEKYVVANGDESEPGTFKDRELMLRTPHLVVEGLIIAGLLTGASAGYIYVRHEYFEQIHALEEEIHRAERQALCGDNVLGTGIALPLRVVESPGGYICGEQSALIEAMEDRRAQPRNRPPELGANGLRDKPTAVNNVETLAWAPSIVLNGGQKYADGGWRSPEGQKAPIRFKGRRLFSVSGDVNRPGVYEVPVGIPLGELIDDVKYCGSMLRDRPLKAVAPSGPSSGLLPAMIPVSIPAEDKYEKWLADAVSRLRSDDEKAAISGFALRHLPPGSTALDIRHLPLDLSFFRNINGLLRLPAEAMLGAGITVFAEGADILDLAVNFTRFFRNESCGKCVPCRIGSQKLYQIGVELLAKRASGALSASEVFGAAKDDPACVKADVKLLGDVLQPTSICGLGYVAPIPLGSVLAYFPNEVVKPSGAPR